jgi:hypothetical protein
MAMGTGANNDGWGGGGGGARLRAAMSAAWAEAESKATDAIDARIVPDFMTISPEQSLMVP